MEDKTAEKTNYTIGYSLIVIGVVIMVACVLNGYGLFKGGKPIQLFSFNGISLDLGKALTSGLPTELQGQGVNLTQQLFSSEMINDPLNLTVHLFFLYFFASMGQKIAQLGVSLVRVIKINQKP